MEFQYVRSSFFWAMHAFLHSASSASSILKMFSRGIPTYMAAMAKPSSA